MVVVQSLGKGTTNEVPAHGYRVYLANENGMVLQRDSSKAMPCCQKGMEVASVKRRPLSIYSHCCDRRYSVSIQWELSASAPKPKLRFLIVPFDALGFALPMGEMTNPIQDKVDDAAQATEIMGSVTLEVTDAEAFAHHPQVKVVLRMAIAESIPGIEVFQVLIVSVKRSKRHFGSRRLPPLRRLRYPGKVIVEYKIMLPPTSKVLEIDQKSIVPSVLIKSINHYAKIFGMSSTAKMAVIGKVTSQTWGTTVTGGSSLRFSVSPCTIIFVVAGMLVGYVS
jgi:hypothetical protein